MRSVVCFRVRSGLPARPGPARAPGADHRPLSVQIPSCKLFQGERLFVKEFLGHRTQCDRWSASRSGPGSRPGPARPGPTRPGPDSQSKPPTAFCTDSEMVLKHCICQACLKNGLTRIARIARIARMACGRLTRISRIARIAIIARMSRAAALELRGCVERRRLSCEVDHG